MNATFMKKGGRIEKICGYLQGKRTSVFPEKRREKLSVDLTGKLDQDCQKN